MSSTCSSIGILSQTSMLDTQCSENSPITHIDRSKSNSKNFNSWFVESDHNNVLQNEDDTRNDYETPPKRVLDDDDELEYDKAVEIVNHVLEDYDQSFTA